MQFRAQIAFAKSPTEVLLKEVLVSLKAYNIKKTQGMLEQILN
jgi:hypothetical protein